MSTSPPPSPNPNSVYADLSNASSSAKATAKLITDTAVEMGASAEQARHWGIRWGTAVLNVQGIFGNILATLIQLAVPLITFFLDTLLNLRQETLDATATIAGAALSEFLGVELDVKAPNLKSKGAATWGVAKNIGDTLYNQLEKEFAVPHASNPGPGETAARAFSGIGVNFAVQNTIISTLADALSFHELQEFRELGVGVARNLGLGRLQRLALGTLLQQSMQKPYQRELAARLRPDRCTVTEYVHSYHRGEIDLPTLQAEIANLGYRDQDITKLINEYDTKVSVAECVLLMRYGEMDADTAQAQLVSQGMTPGVATWKLRAAQLTLINDNVTSYATAIGDLKKAGRLDQDTYTTLLNAVPWTDDEKTWTQRATGIALEFPDMKLTWAQVTTAYEQGIVDVDYVEKWLNFNLYSLEDVLNMELLLAVKFDAFVAAAAKTAAALAAKNAKANPPATAP